MPRRTTPRTVPAKAAAAATTAAPMPIAPPPSTPDPFAPPVPFVPATDETDAQAADRARADFLAQQRAKLQALGIAHLFGDVLPDNAQLQSALATIRAAGAPEPTIVTEKLEWPGGQATVDIYEYRHKAGYSVGDPAALLRSTEYLLAVSPYVVIAELQTLGIIPPGLSAQQGQPGQPS